MTTIYTVGHSTHSQEEFIDMLLSHGIEVLVDIRSFPGSRKYPHFNQENMCWWLLHNNIKYVHIPKLGGRRRKLNIESPNDGWRNESFKNYADYTLTNEFEEGLEELLLISNNYKVCYMCSECVPWRCHRSIVSDILVSRGVNVKHIMNNKTANEHKMISFGVVEGDHVIYPSKQLSLF